MRYSVVFMNITENLIATGSTATAPQPINQVIKPIKFPAQPQEWKIVSLRECPTPDTMQHCETPDQASAYWKSHIATHPYFNSECKPVEFDASGTASRRQTSDRIFAAKSDSANETVPRKSDGISSTAWAKRGR